PLNWSPEDDREQFSGFPTDNLEAAEQFPFNCLATGIEPQVAIGPLSLKQPSCPLLLGSALSLLHKARTTAQIGMNLPSPVEPLSPQVLDKAVFSEPVIMQENIPYPKLFSEVVQRQWNPAWHIPQAGRECWEAFQYGSFLLRPLGAAFSG
ncbi:hypothetical protein E2320_002252, partial [Naja naja]